MRKTAVDSWLYAQLAENAYSGGKEPAKGHQEYQLPSYVTEHGEVREFSKSGYAARTYLVTKPVVAPHVVVAFRGTQFGSWRDWWFGNIRNTQYEQGVDHVTEIKEQFQPMRVVTTGHSLGAAIATYVSLHLPKVAAYGFNASGRLCRGPAYVNDRSFVSQHGEVNVLVRRPFKNAGGTYTTINCLERGRRAGPVARHDMTKLADCLTRIAAASGDRAAEISVEQHCLGSVNDVLRRN